MSCITKILQVKGDKPILINKHNEIAIEGGGVFKGYEYIITFTNRGHRCGYVAVPETHPLHSSKEEYPDYEVHGGVTFFEDARFDEFTGGHKCTDKWIGFDAAHVYDKPCRVTTEKYFNLSKEKDEMRILFDTLEAFQLADPDFGETHKSYAYMVNECRSLINQLVKQAA